MDRGFDYSYNLSLKGFYYCPMVLILLLILLLVLLLPSPMPTPLPLPIERGDRVASLRGGAAALAYDSEPRKVFEVREWRTSRQPYM